MIQDDYVPTSTVIKVVKDQDQVSVGCMPAMKGGYCCLFWTSDEELEFIWENDSPLTKFKIDAVRKLTFYQVTGDYGRYRFYLRQCTAPTQDKPSFVDYFQVVPQGIGEVVLGGARHESYPPVVVKFYQSSPMDNLLFVKEDLRTGRSFTEPVLLTIDGEHFPMEESQFEYRWPVADHTTISANLLNTAAEFEVGGGQEADVELGPPPKP